jgi:hypothetical protein
MEKCFYYFRLSTYETVLFDRRFIALVFLAAMIIGVVKLYLEEMAPVGGPDPQARIRRAISKAFPWAWSSP